MTIDQIVIEMGKKRHTRLATELVTEWRVVLNGSQRAMLASEICKLLDAVVLRSAAKEGR